MLMRADRIEARVNQAEELRKQDRHGELVAAFQHVIKRNPDNVRAPNKLTHVYCEVGRYDAYQHGTESNPQ